ncbi:MAG TPA: hypothetical protein VMI35_11590 [Puia sp.]|nr:hypothetical protein [Puia sp.]
MLTMLSTGCGSRPKLLDQRISLWRKDRIPYGTFYAYENLRYIFPRAIITENNSSPADYRYFVNTDYSSQSNTTKQRKGYIIIAPRVIPDQREINALMNFVGEGNQVFISAFHIGDSLLSSLKIKMAGDSGFFASEKLGVSVYSPITGDSMSFTYPGLALDNGIDSLDTTYTTVLGRDRSGHPNFVRFSYKGGGNLFLHFAPLALTNFFLLHQDNKAYYDNVFSYLPSGLEEVKWDDYFRYPRNSNFSAFQFILNSRPLRWAFWLVLLLFGIVYLFESKRRQRMIPAIGSLRNSSLDFVKTIGRLYYQRKDHGDLASKMSAQFLDHVRSKYNIPTSLMNEAFIDRVSYKSGYHREGVADLVTWIRMFQDGYTPRDEELLDFNQKIEAFYKQA